MNFLVLNGPNLNLLGLREPEIYGSRTYGELCQVIRQAAQAGGDQVDIRQSNHEGVLVDWIQAAYGRFDGIIFNPAAYTHTGIALLDALQAVGIPTAEVHLSDVDRREPFRRISYIRPACLFTVTGRGFAGYVEAMARLKAAILAGATAP